MIGFGGLDGFVVGATGELALVVQGLRAWRFGVVGCFCALSFGLNPKPLQPPKP